MFGKSSTAVAVLALCTVGFAQADLAGLLNRHRLPATAAQNGGGLQERKARAHAIPNTNAPSDCAYTFTSGGTATKRYLQYCVTVNGNITEFQSPLGIEDIRVGTTFGEGYAICDGTTNTLVAYYDYADYGDTGNWMPAVLLSHTATLVKIARTTSDGIWTLTQTITQNAAGASAKVAMALKNNTAIPRSGLLLRMAKVNADTNTINNLDASEYGAWGYSPGDNGLMLQLGGESPLPHIGFALQNNPYDPCNPTQYAVGTLTNYDGGSMEFFFLMSLGAHKSLTVNLQYVGF